MNENRTVKSAVIGCGGIANGKHLPAATQIKGVEFIAFCDLKAERAQKTADKFGVPGAKVYTNYEELLKDPEIEVVHVCTPNSSHAPIAIAAMEAGKHVLCEKPMAINYAQAKAMCDTAKKTGMKLSIGYQNRYRPDSRYLKALCEAGDLGEIYYAKAIALRRRGVPTWGVFLDEEKQGGGPLIDIGTHALDLTLWMMNNYEPEYVVGTTYKKLRGNKNAANCFGSWDPEKYTVEDSAFGFIRFKNGATVSLESSWALNTLDVREAQCELCGTLAGADMKDGLRINGEKAGRLYITRPDFESGSVAFFDGVDDTNESILEQATFYSHIRCGTPLTVLPEQAATVTRILEAIYTSSATGKPVYFD